MTTKKHFQEIAETLYQEDAHEQLIIKIANTLEKTSKNFNRKQFILTANGYNKKTQEEW